MIASSVSSSKIRLNHVIMQSNGMSVVSWQDKRLDNGGVYAQNINWDGSFGLVGVVNTGVVAQNFEMKQNYPNPFNPATSISYSIPQSGNVSLTVYNSLGSVVKELFSGSQNAGTYEAKFDASGLSSGIYFYSIKVSGSNGVDFSDTKKMILVK